MNHEITLDCSTVAPGILEVKILEVTCSCGEFSWTHTLPVKWTDISFAVAEHLRPQMEEVTRELLKMISVKDIIKMIRRKP